MKKLLTILSILLVATLFAGCSLLPTSTPVKKVGQGVPETIKDLVNYDGLAYHPEQIMVRYAPGADVEALMAKQGSTVIRQWEPINWALVSVPAGKTVVSHINDVRKQRGILLAEPNFEYQLDTVPEVVGYGEQWGFKNMNAEAAWDITTGSQDVIVAIIDTGVQVDHPEFADKVFVGAYDATHYDEAAPDDVADYDGHGTHVAGIAADNGAGGLIAGVAWDNPIMPIRVRHPYNGKIYTDFLADAMIYVANYAINNPTKRVVVNMSIGGTGYNFSFKDAIDYAFDANVLLITSAGNDHKRIPNSYPSAYNGVVSVAASTPHDTKADFSTVGSFNSVAAPGVLILSTYMGSAYTNLQGTSMASPYVAGAAALLLSHNPSLSALEVKNQIEQTARGNGHTEELGYGIIDIAAMLGEIKPMQYGSLSIMTDIIYSDLIGSVGVGIVTVYDKASGDMVAYGTTGNFGNHYLPAMKPGTYTVNVTYYDAYIDEYQIVQQEVTVEVNGQHVVNFDMTVPTGLTRTQIGESQNISVALDAEGGPVAKVPFTADVDSYYEFVTSSVDGVIGCDTTIKVFDATNKLVGSIDYYDYDTLGIYLKAGSYTVEIGVFKNETDLSCKYEVFQVTPSYEAI